MNQKKPNEKKNMKSSFDKDGFKVKEHYSEIVEFGRKDI